MSNPLSHQPIESTVGQHHVHRDNEPLPGARGGQPAVDYSPDTIERARLPSSEEGATQDLRHHPKVHHHDQHGAGVGPTSLTGDHDQSALNTGHSLGTGRDQSSLNTGHGHSALGTSHGQSDLGASHGQSALNTGHGQSALGTGHRQDPLNSGTGHNLNTGSTGLRGDSPDLHEVSDTKPSVGDKLVGKTQELAGKALRKEGLQEKGAMRQQGEKF